MNPSNPYGWPFWLYLLCCLLGPALWGLVSAWVFEKVDQKLKSKDPKEQSV